MPKWVAHVLPVLILMGCHRDESAPSALGSRATAESAGLPDHAASSDRQWRLGQEELANGDTLAALAHFRNIPRDGSAISIQAALAAGQAQQSIGQLSPAIDSYEYVLQHRPDQYAVVGRVAELYALTGQRTEADRHLSRLARTPDLGFKPLVLLTDFERRHGEDLTRLQELERLAPDDPAVQLGLAVEEMNRGEVGSAQRRLEAAVALDPQLSTAQALLGEVLLLESSSDSLVRWHHELPESVQDHAAIWYTRGLWAQQLNEPSVAARCFWESARQCPTSYRAIYQLGLVSGDLDPEIRRSFARRAEDIHELKENLSRVLDSGGRDEAAARSLVQMLLDSGREWEAWSWTVMTQAKHPRSPWLQQAIRRLASYPHTQAPRILDSANLAMRFDLSHYPDFGSIAPRLDALADEPRAALPREAIRFTEVAGSLGIDFTYHRGRVAGLDGVRMQETTGGGVGVLDYDNDGWPDLFFTQGEDWPIGASAPAGSPTFHDALFRNLGTRFQNQTSLALPEEDGFGQGCACGDFNNDGFADIYVANIGANQLLINNGDGTFTDSTPTAALSQQAWTTSCAMADLNADGSPDLFDVNYLEGPQLFHMTCNESDCSPEGYQEARDYALISLGDGGTRLVEPNTHGRVGGGLGVVVFRTDRGVIASSAFSAASTSSVSTSAVDNSTALTPESHLSLFVANDQDPNEFLKVAPTQDPEVFALNDEAFLAGLALNYNGNTTACMGVAAGDVSGDGRLDLFVTNYRDEANTLYVQEADRSFSDSIRGSGLLHAGLPYIGWGTQCLDADNDGDLDLVVANGHVGYFERDGVQERMPTQLFGNRGAGRFEEVPPDELGAFFNRAVMGRSLATLDWDRDGRTECVLSLLDENVAVLKNQSTETGNWLAVRLIGTASARDAIGTVVTIHTQDGVIRRQLTAGDGYQATNERVLRFGLGDCDSIEKVTIEWPGEQMQTLEYVPANTVLGVVEGRRHMTLWTGTTPAAFND